MNTYLGHPIVERKTFVATKCKDLPGAGRHVICDAEQNENNEHRCERCTTLTRASGMSEDRNEGISGWRFESLGQVGKAEAISDQHKKDHKTVDNIAPPHGSGNHQRGIASLFRHVCGRIGAYTIVSVLLVRADTPRHRGNPPVSVHTSKICPATILSPRLDHPP